MKTLRYEVKGKIRKQLVDTISKALATEAEYLGAPSYAYQIGDYTVDRDGNIEIPDEMTQANIDFIIEELAKENFAIQPNESPETPDNEAENNSSPATEESSGEDIDLEESNPVKETQNSTDGEESNKDPENIDEDISTKNERISISIPREKIDPDCLKRIQAIIASKAPVLKVALETDDLSITSTDNELKFPWFTNHGIEGEAQAYADFIAAIVARAKKLTRVTASECARDNDKFVMRLFLVALEMKGDRYKDARRILMRNLKGDGGWRTRAAKDKHDAKVGKVEKAVDVSAVQIVEGGEKNE